MTYNLPFYSVSVEKPVVEIYHTHPQCRVAQKVAPDRRVAGMGEGRKECPFCFVLGQFRSGRLAEARPGTPAPAGAPPEYAAAVLGG